MSKICLECGKKKGIFAYNYAGFDVRRVGSHPIVDRIEPLVLPGTKSKDFLCVDCANKRKVVCGKHGEIQGRIEHGAVPVCQKCTKDAEARQFAMEWKYWGEFAQVLPCPFCGEKTFRGTFDWLSNQIRMNGTPLSSGEQMEQKCDHCGKTFESRLSSEDERLQRTFPFHWWRPGPAYAKD